ncbi:MAG: hypothetical protein WCE61_01250, partial [Candidatus Acidiferrum sp.]
PQKQKRPDQSRGASFYQNSKLQQQSIVKENWYKNQNRRKSLNCWGIAEATLDFPFSKGRV